MATELWLTDGVTRVAVGAVPYTPPLTQAIDVSKFDQADLILTVHAFEGAAGPSVTVTIIGGMQLDSEDGWVTWGSFSAVTVAGVGVKLNVPGLPKYLRAKVTALSGATAVVYSVRGMARNN